MIVCAFVPSIYCVHAVPDLDRKPLWRCTCHGSDWFRSHSCGSSYDDKATASRFDGGLCLRGELCSVSFRVSDIDFSDQVNGWLGLSMEPADGWLQSQYPQALPILDQNIAS